MNLFYAAHIIISMFGTAILATFFGWAAVLAFIIGASISIINLMLINFSWKRILAKKRIALSVAVIVFKYATLGFIIRYLTAKNRIDVGWFSVGLGVIILSILIAGLKHSDRLNRSETPI